MKFFTQILILLVNSMLLISITSAQEHWYVSTAFQIIGSKFRDETAHNSYYLYGGVRYQAQKFNLSVSMPVVYDSGNQFIRVGNSGLSDSHMDGSNDNDSTDILSPINVGLGDIYLNGSFKLMEGKKVLPSVSINGYIKFPSASTHLGIGTGEYDFQLALGLRKYINNFSFFGQFGYLYLGKSVVSESIIPFTLSLGIGYAFGYGKHSILLTYDSYSTIIQGFTSPEQLGLGYNYLITKRVFLTSIASVGLNSPTSDYTLSTGFNIGI